MRLLLLFILCSTQVYAQDCPDSCEYFIPNSVYASTKDCYGCSELEIVSNCPFKSYRFTVYNRWGELVFESEDPKIRLDAADHKTGIYTWKLDAVFCNMERVEDNGTVNVIK